MKKRGDEELMRGKPGESTLYADKKFSNTNFFLKIQNNYYNKYCIIKFFHINSIFLGYVSF